MAGRSKYGLGFGVAAQGLVWPDACTRERHGKPHIEAGHCAYFSTALFHAGVGALLMIGVVVRCTKWASRGLSPVVNAMGKVAISPLRGVMLKWKWCWALRLVFISVLSFLVKLTRIKFNASFAATSTSLTPEPPPGAGFSGVPLR